MAAPRQIPGFYFDAEKKKYFKIQPNHVAPPGAQYSVANVKKQANERKRKREAERVVSCSKRMRRAEILQRYPGPAGLYREIGRCDPQELDRARRVAYGETLEVRIEEDFPEVNRFTAMAVEPVSGVVMAGVKVVDNSYSLMWFDSTNQRFENRRLCYMLSSEVNSVNFVATDNALSMLATTSTGTYVWALITHTPKDDSPTKGRRRLRPSFRFQRHEAAIVPETSMNIWSSAPGTRTGCYAVGTDNDVLLLQHRHDMRQIELATCIPTVTDVFAVAFMSHDVLAVGLRSGVIEIVKFREGMHPRTLLQIRHPGSITHLRQISDHLLLVNGLESSLRLYDLRYIPNDVRSPLRKVKTANICTPAVLEFEHRNDYRRDLGLDVDLDLGLLAVGRDDNTVALFSLYTAERILSPALRAPFRASPRCVQFSRLQSADWDGPTLWVGAGNSLYKYQV